MGPAIIEVAINGITSKAQNPRVPRSPEEIADEAIRCIEAGAAIIHNHNEDIHQTGEAAAARYGLGWAPVLAKYPGAILCPTTTLAPTITEKLAHFKPCAEKGARMGAIDPGSVNLASTAADGSPGSTRFIYVNGFDELDLTVAELGAAGLGPSIAIYEPGFLRATLAYHRAGKLPKGAMVKLYFGGPRDFFQEDARGGSAVSALSFGLPPTAKALDAYLEMLDGSGLTWSVAVLGGDVVESGMARLALERGGHVRIGLEDYMGDRRPSNPELLEAVLAECRRAGRRPARLEEAAEILGLSA